MHLISVSLLLNVTILFIVPQYVRLYPSGLFQAGRAPSVYLLIKKGTLMSIARRFYVCAFLGIFAVAQSLGGGFQLNEHGAKGMSQAGAFAARANDGSAIFFNPAGLGFQSNASVYLGTTIITPVGSFWGPTQNNTSTKTDNVSLIFTPINAYVVVPAMDRLTVGIGVMNPYGLGSEWNENWVGRFLTVKIELQSFYFNPTVAYRLTDEFSIGAGFSYVLGSVNLSKKVAIASVATPAEPMVTLDMTGNGIGWTAGALYKFSPSLSVGLSYRSAVKMDADGSASFEPNYAALGFPAGDVSTSITLPATGFAGIAYKVCDNVELEADFQYIWWSSYDELKIDFKANNSSSISPKNYQDTYIARLGGEYSLGDLKLRGGYYFDHSPVKSDYLEPMLPDADRHGFNLGLGYQLTDHINVDLSYLFIKFLERKAENTIPEISFDGTYKTYVNLFGVDLGYTF
jgi:long-chain fatty acid transport protein